MTKARRQDVQSFLFSTSLIGLVAGLPAAALAQSALSQSGGSQSGGPKAVVEEVVVTAQKRQQNLQEVPISVSAFTGSYIDKVHAQTMGDLQKFTPGLTVDTSSTTQPKFTIRGIATDDFGIGTDPAVGVFIDGVYSARSGAALVFLNDIERVEILKGPQGTLFGRNTTAGAISIISNKPSSEFDAKAQVETGNYNKVRFDGTLNLPITDTLAARFNVIVNRRDGFIKNSFNGKDVGDESNETFRAALRWRPNATTDINLTWDHDNTDQAGPMAIGLGPFSPTKGNPFVSTIANDVVDSHERRKLDGFALSINETLGAISLTSISAYKMFFTTNRESETGGVGISRYFDTDNREKNRSFYQELRASGTLGAFTGTIGGSFNYENARQINGGLTYTNGMDTVLQNLQGFQFFAPFAAAGVPVNGLEEHEDIHDQGKSKSWAAFGDVTYAVTPKLNLTAGLRFTKDSKSFTWLQDPASIPGLNKIVLPGAVYNGFLDAIGAPQLPPTAMIDFDTFRQLILGPSFIYSQTGAYAGQVIARQASWTNTSPRFVVDYHWTDNVMTYASLALGYKAGGFDAVSLNSYFKPEKVTNYEGGIKSDWLDKTLRVNAAVFHYLYKDRQQLSFVQPCPTCLPQYNTITGDNEATGFDIDGQYLVNRNLSLSLDAGWVDSTWAKRTEQSQLTGKPLNLAGQPTGEPELRIVLGADYIYPLASNWGQLKFHFDHSYTSKRRANQAIIDTDASLRPLVNFGLLKNYRGSQEFTDLRLTWLDPSERYSISAFVQNLGDNQYVSEINTITTPSFGTPYTRLSNPRFFGVDLGVKW